MKGATQKLKTLSKVVHLLQQKQNGRTLLSNTKYGAYNLVGRNHTNRTEIICTVCCVIDLWFDGTFGRFLINSFQTDDCLQ